MLKQEIKYTDYNDVEREETFYFNLTKAELARFVTAKGESFSEAIRVTMNDRNGEDILRVMDEIIRLSYGKKTDSGRFIKSDDVWEDFRYGGAYDALYLEFLTDSAKSLAFIQGILPAEVASNLKKDIGGDLTEEKVTEFIKKGGTDSFGRPTDSQ